MSTRMPALIDGDRVTDSGHDVAKRTLDVAGASVGLVLASPLLLVVAAAIRLVIGRPVLFRQERPGLHGLPFVLVKFRTMRPMVAGTRTESVDDDRLTPLGTLLRRTSLDELPELFNVLKGDMSLVGPRPLLMVYLDRYAPEQARRHLVKPGITGWAQVNGRNALTWHEKFAFDLWYVDHRTLWLDLKILGMTVKQVIAGKGISAPGHPTMPDFMGSR